MSQKIADWLKAATKKLGQAGIGTARLDTLVMLEDCLGKGRTQLLADPESELTTEQIKVLNDWLRRRERHEPLAYIRGKTEFYGREFCLDHRVLEPRPESETMIDLLKALPMPSKPVIADIGTGSGALAITANLEISGAEVIATDIDPKCLIVARRNDHLLQADVKFIQGNLLEPVATSGLSPTVLLCNLPYVPDNFQINPAAMNEPRIAIFGGQDGLDIYRKLFGQIKTLKLKPEFILTEAMPPQHDQLVKIAADSGFRLKQTDDFIQVFII